MTKRTLVAIDEIGDLSHDVMMALRARLALPLALCVAASPSSYTEAHERDREHRNQFMALCNGDTPAWLRRQQERRRKKNFRLHHGHHLPKRLRGRGRT